MSEYDGHTIDIGYVHVLTEPGGPCVDNCPHPEHYPDMPCEDCEQGLSSCCIPPALPIHRTEAGYPRCATCDGGGCLDCTDPA